jgi:TonB-dependent receptor
MRVFLTTTCAAAAIAAAVPATAQDAGSEADQSAPALGQQAPAVGGDIIVTGLRRSIGDAISAKRNATNIIDSIVAEDIGKLPDQTVMDSMSRIPGVQITKYRGDASGFTIRGISQNLTLIDGRPFQASLGDVSSDIISSVDIIKTPSADMIEGALGGTVDLKTKRPLALPDLVVAGRGAVEFPEVNGKAGFRGSALLSKHLGDHFGALLNVAYQDISATSQVFESQGYATVSTIDGNGDGKADPLLQRIQRLSLSDLPGRTRRWTVNGSLEWRPDDSLSVVADGTYNYAHFTASPHRLQILLNNNAIDASADQYGTIVSGEFDGVTYRPLVYQEESLTRSMSFGLRGNWKKNGWDISVDGSYFKADAPHNGDTFTFVVVPNAGLYTNTTFNLVGSDLPNFAVASNFDLNNPNNFHVSSLSDVENPVHNNAKAARVDIGRDLGSGFLNRLSLGYRYEEREQRSAQYRGVTSLAVLTGDLDANNDGVIELGEIPYTPSMVSGVFKGLDGDIIRSYLGGTIDKDAARALVGEPALQPTTQSNVSETKNAFYAKLDVAGSLFGKPLHGNIGGRYVMIDRDVLGYTDVGAAAGGILPVEAKTHFRQFLPSATLVLDLTDKFLLRASAARVMATPDLGLLSSGFVFSVVNNQGAGGNPSLKPFLADQADLSAEWYFSRNSLLSVAGFYKKVNSFTINRVVETDPPAGYSNPNDAPLPLLITRPTNGTDGKIYGIEANYQQALTFLPAPLDGFGYQLSYTFADSKAPNSLGTGTEPLPNLSKNSYSAILYYDKGRLEGRLAYTYRDGYLQSETIPTTDAQGNITGNAAGNTYVAATDSLDGSLQFALTRKVKLTLDVQNILKSTTRLYQGNYDRVYSIEVDDRRWFLGVAASF